MSLNPKKTEELSQKLENFEKEVASSIESCITNDQDQVNQGEYLYLVDDHMGIDHITLNEDLQDVLDESTISKTELIEKVIKEKLFKMEYEELSNPFHYGGAQEDEFQTVPWGGDRDCQIDKSSEEMQKCSLSFNLKDYFDDFADFKEFSDFECGRIEYLQTYWNLFAKNSDRENVVYNTDYDTIRCLIDEKHQETLINWLKASPKPEEVFTPKVLKITQEEFIDLEQSHSGLCLKCGKINEGNHEPDARKYACEHCETQNSYGITECLVMGNVEIVDASESQYEDSFE